jgi:hypothetical protein
MGNTIACIQADNQGNKLWLKDFRFDGEKTFIKYRSTYNDIPFKEIEIFVIDGNFVITGDDGKVIFRFSPSWVDLIL